MGSHLQALLPLFLPLTADSLLLCSLGAAIFLHDRPAVSGPWKNCAYILQTKKPYNSLLQLNQLLFFLFPAVKVNLDQGLELHQVLLHPFTMDILQRREGHNFCMTRHFNKNQQQQPFWEQIIICLNFLFLLTYIKIHLFSIRNLWRDQVGHHEWPEIENDKITYRVPG